MAGARVPTRRTRRMVGLTVAGWLVHAGGALAFPLIEPTTADTGVGGTELAAPDAQDLRHQLQLANGLAAPAGGGWTIVPRISVQEALNDNLFQVNSPRRADLTTYVSPGIAIAGETSHLQLTVNYAPTLEMNMINGSQNSVTQQLNAIGLLTLVPDRLYVDLRAIAGVQATNGLLGGVGSLGNAGIAPVSSGGLGGLSGNGVGLAKNNRTQTMSFGISPYVVGRLGHFGDYRIGTSVDVSHSSSASGFLVLPFTGGTAPQTLLTTQQVAHFSSGDYFTNLQDSLDISLSQSNSSFDQTVPSAPGLNVPNNTTTSRNDTVTDQLTWHYSQTVALLGSLGYENIHYSGANGLDIHDITWSVGTTLTPNPDSFITLTYGRQQGADAFNLNANYLLTARTSISASYSNTVGTQLQNLQRQLDLAGSNGNGGLVNGRTQGALFNGSNLLSVQPGVYRFSSFSLNTTTTLDRDTISVALSYTKQTSVGSGQFNSTNSSTTGGYASAQWIHSLTPAMTLSGGVSYSRQNYSNRGGLAQTVSAGAVLQYTLSETVSTSLRYVFSSQSSSTPGLSFYQDLLIAGITKQF